MIHDPLSITKWDKFGHKKVKIQLVFKLKECVTLIFMENSVHVIYIKYEILPRLCDASLLIGHTIKKTM